METWVVTGASSGIGREIAIQSAMSGREIWLVGRDAGRLDEVAREVGARGAVAHAVAMDLADVDAAARFLDETFPAGRRVDVVHLAAAITLFGEVKDTLAEDWDEVYRTNLLSPVQWTVHFYRHMVEAGAGRIVIISSLAAYAGYPTAAAYATMKAGLLGLFRSLVHEGAAFGVALHLASPGYVDTLIYRRARFRNTSYERTMRHIRSLGFRILSAEEAARIILRRVARGNREFALPLYASAMKWLVPRFPFLIRIVHERVLRDFRRAA